MLIKRKGLIRMMFVKHMLICILVLFFAWLVPFFFTGIITGGDISESLSTIILIAIVVTHIALIFFYYKRGFNLFALPLSHLIFPFFILALLFLFDIGFPNLMESSDPFYIMVTAVIYFLPVTLITAVISVIMMARGRQGAK